MPLKIPKLLEPDTRDIDDIIRRDNRRLRVRSRQRRTQRHDKVEQVLVQGEQTQHALWHRGRLLGFVRQVRGLEFLRIRRHVLAV